MNPKIKELSGQADQYALSITGFCNHDDFNRIRDTKFAELIVRECMDMVIAHEDDAPEEFHKLWLHLKEHFGVE